MGIFGFNFEISKIFRKRYFLKLFLFHLLFILLIPRLAMSESIPEQDILDAILGKRTFSDEHLNQMDLNADGTLDVADVVYLKQPIASFADPGSDIDETIGTHNVVINFSKSINVTLKYTVGGTATADEDYTALSGEVVVNGNSVIIPLSIISDTVFEGNETIKLSLVPSVDYLLGQERSHTITLKDNPYGSGADYIFILSSETLGVEGSPTEQKGFPPTLFSRTASINIMFSENNVLDAILNVAGSIGISDTETNAETIPSTSVSYNLGVLEMVFEYNTLSESFVTNPSIDHFNPDSPSFGNQNKKKLTNILTMQVNNFDISSEKFTDKQLEGIFSIGISGVLNDETTSFFNGTLVGTMQQ